MGGRGPVAAGLEVDDDVEDEDIALGSAREKARGGRARGSERRPAESERCSVM